MTIEIEQVTDFTAIEDAIADWIKAASGLPDYATATLPSDKSYLDGGRAIYWEGSEFERIRPYILITPISQPTQGQPWERKELINDAGTDKWQTTYLQPFKWTVQFTAYVDTYDTTHRKIRTTAYRYMQNVINRSFIPSVANILEAEEIAFHPMGQTIVPNVLAATDDDKYIQQASLEYVFSGVAQTKEKDTDFFTSVTTPTEDNGGLTLAEA